MRNSQLTIRVPEPTSIVRSPKKKIGPKRKKQVGRTVSIERDLMSLQFVVFPLQVLVFLFPRQRINPQIMKAYSPGVVGFANGSGWMDSDFFGLFHEPRQTQPNPEGADNT